MSQAPASLIDLRATICEATQTCEPPPHGVSVLSLPEDTKRERVLIEYATRSVSRSVRPAR